MKKVFLCLTMALISVWTMAQTQNYNQVVWLNGRMMYANPIPSIDSITFTADATAQDTLYMLLPRAVVTVQHDTVYVDKIDTVFIYKCPYAGIGSFSVSADKRVAFAAGNLQYQAGTDTWRFAENQYDYIGSDNSNISSTYDGWIDLFGWSAGNTTAPFGISTSKNNADYSGDFADWGSNTIGADGPGMWRTLTADEWYYVFCARANAGKLFGVGSVDGVKGTILLPDDWTTPSGVVFTPSTEKGLTDQGGYYTNTSSDNYSHNTYTLADWEKMEEAGAVFLPAVGRRYGQSVSGVQSRGGYWSSSTEEATRAYILEFLSSNLNPKTSTARCYGFSVRLVKEL